MQTLSWSSGGGMQSIAGLVLSARGIIDFPLHLFCNTGDDSENPETLEYVRSVAMPYAQAHGIEFLELSRTFKRGPLARQQETLLSRIYRTQKSVPIPIRRSGGMPLARTCTIDFKIRVIVEFLKAHGANANAPAISGIGFSIDEWSRVKPALDSEQILVYPLIELGMSRTDCAALIESEGLPIPPKSACWFCPNKSHLEWVKMANEQPELFEKAARIEDHLSEKYGEPLFLHRALYRLRGCVNQYYFDMDDTQDCSGFCLT